MEIILNTPTPHHHNIIAQMEQINRSFKDDNHDGLQCQKCMI